MPVVEGVGVVDASSNTVLLAVSRGRVAHAEVLAEVQRAFKSKHAWENSLVVSKPIHLVAMTSKDDACDWESSVLPILERCSDVVSNSCGSAKVTSSRIEQNFAAVYLGLMKVVVLGMDGTSTVQAVNKRTSGMIPWRSKDNGEAAVLLSAPIESGATRPEDDVDEAKRVLEQLRIEFGVVEPGQEQFKATKGSTDEIEFIFGSTLNSAPTKDLYFSIPLLPPLSDPDLLDSDDEGGSSENGKGFSEEDDETINGQPRGNYSRIKIATPTRKRRTLSVGTTNRMRDQAEKESRAKGEGKSFDDGPIRKKTSSSLEGVRVPDEAAAALAAAGELEIGRELARSLSAEDDETVLPPPPFSPSALEISFDDGDARPPPFSPPREEEKATTPMGRSVALSFVPPPDESPPDSEDEDEEGDNYEALRRKSVATPSSPPPEDDEFTDEEEEDDEHDDDEPELGSYSGRPFPPPMPTINDSQILSIEEQRGYESPVDEDVDEKVNLLPITPPMAPPPSSLDDSGFPESHMSPPGDNDDEDFAPPPPSSPPPDMLEDYDDELPKKKIPIGIRPPTDVSDLNSSEDDDDDEERAPREQPNPFDQSELEPPPTSSPQYSEDEDDQEYEALANETSRLAMNMESMDESLDDARLDIHPELNSRPSHDAEYFESLQRRESFVPPPEASPPESEEELDEDMDNNLPRLCGESAMPPESAPPPEESPPASDDEVLTEDIDGAQPPKVPPPEAYTASLSGFDGNNVAGASEGQANLASPLPGELASESLENSVYLRRESIAIPPPDGSPPPDDSDYEEDLLPRTSDGIPVPLPDEPPPPEDSDYEEDAPPWTRTSVSLPPPEGSPPSPDSDEEDDDVYPSSPNKQQIFVEQEHSANHEPAMHSDGEEEVENLQNDELPMHSGGEDEEEKRGDQKIRSNVADERDDLNRRRESSDLRDPEMDPLPYEVDEVEKASPPSPIAPPESQPSGEVFKEGKASPMESNHVSVPPILSKGSRSYQVSDDLDESTNVRVAIMLGDEPSQAQFAMSDGESSLANQSYLTDSTYRPGDETGSSYNISPDRATLGYASAISPIQEEPPPPPPPKIDLHVHEDCVMKISKGGYVGAPRYRGKLYVASPDAMSRSIPVEDLAVVVPSTTRALRLEPIGPASEISGECSLNAEIPKGTPTNPPWQVGIYYVENSAAPLPIKIACGLDFVENPSTGVIAGLVAVKLAGNPSCGAKEFLNVSVEVSLAGVDVEIVDEVMRFAPADASWDPINRRILWRPMAEAFALGVAHTFQAKFVTDRMLGKIPVPAVVRFEARGLTHSGLDLSISEDHYLVRGIARRTIFKVDCLT